MVGPLTVLKMLHCRNIGKSLKEVSLKRKREPSGRVLRDVDTKNFNVNVDVKVEKIGELCRVCLREGRIPIYETSSSEDLADALNTIGGIEVSVDDTYPKFLCHSCHALLQGAIMFRKTAQKSDELLKMQTKQEVVPEIDDHFDDIAEDIDKDASYELEEQNDKITNILNCKRCDIQFKSFEEYTAHRLTDAHENKRLLCSICEKSYAPEYLKRHMAIHNQKTLYMCDVCGKSFVVQSHFSRHRLTHFFSLPHKCSLCPYRGRFSESLKMHMRSHTGEKPYQCPQCPGRFISKSNLNKHVLTHRGAHDFRCEMCGRGFYTKRELELHFKADHAGIKEHVCRVCDKAFGYRKQMMKHELKVHKRDKLKSGRMPIYLKLESMKQQGIVPLET